LYFGREYSDVDDEREFIFLFKEINGRESFFLFDFTIHFLSFSQARLRSRVTNEANFQLQQISQKLDNLFDIAKQSYKITTQQKYDFNFFFLILIFFSNVNIQHIIFYS